MNNTDIKHRFDITEATVSSTVHTDDTMTITITKGTDKWVFECSKWTGKYNHTPEPKGK